MSYVKVAADLRNEQSWPGWKIALAVCLPVGVISAGAYLYIVRNNKSKKKVIKDEETPVKAVEEVEKVKTVEEINKENLGKSQELKNVGNKLFKEGKYSDAIDKYSLAIEICPEEAKLDKATYHQNKAAAYEKQKNWEAVIDECTKAISLNNKYVKAFVRRSRAYEKSGDRGLCLEDITTVCILEKFENRANMLFADQILKKIGFDDAAKNYRNRKHKLPSPIFIKQYFNGFVNDCITDNLTEDEKLIAHQSGYIRAKIAWSEGKLEEVIDECTTEIDSVSDASSEVNEEQKDKNDITAKDRFAKALLLRASFYLLSCKNSEGLKDLNRVIDMTDIQPKIRVNALIKRASLNMQLQKVEEANSDYDLAVTLDPQNPDVYHNRGQNFIILNKISEAIADFNKCIECKPDFALAHAQRCYTKYRQAFAANNIVQIELANAEFEELIKKYPDCSDTYGLYAQAECDRQNFEAADKLFERALEVDPENASLYVHRGTLLLQWKQDCDAAIAMITKALEVDSECDFAHEMLATIAIQQSNVAKALEHFDKAIEFSRTESEMAHLYSLRAAAVAQENIRKNYGITPPSFSSLS